MEEPGIDRHQWIGEYEALEDDLRDSPAEALHELDDLVARMLEARGVAGNDREFAQARAITRQVDEGEDVDPGDVAHAVNTYQSMYAELLEFGADSGEPA